MTCNKRLALADAVDEVKHLHRLNHPHVIQLIGSYILGRKFAILFYPVTEMTLSTFLENTVYPPKCLSRQVWRNQLPLIRFFGCLASALHHIHSCSMRHMDIKPANILVKAPTLQNKYHMVYIADFGISKSFLADDSSQTAGITSRTPKYCSPEVFKGDSKGRPTDIFSMGCVFTEMLTIHAGKDLDEFTSFLIKGEDEDRPYHANLPRVQRWLDQLQGEADIDLVVDPSNIKQML
jgi:serine/threonine protein kinase